MVDGARVSRRQVLAAAATGGVSALGAAAMAKSWMATAAAAAAVRPAGADIGAIEHVIFLMKENRSFDHYFGSYKAVRGFDDHGTSLGAFAQKLQGGLKKAVFGLPEIYRGRIKKARLIANPGCYPTGAILGLMPAVKNNLIDTASIVIDSKSGTSGAGRKADISVAFCEVNEGFRAYSIGVHRHTPEIEQELSLLCGKEITVNFTPHLLPVDRGILTTIYAKLEKKMSAADVGKIYHNLYKKEPFVRLLDYGKYPNIKNVRGTNFCEIGLKLNERTNTLIVVTAIDNLVKGASGQAVHNMNIMMGFDEKTALDALAVFP